MQTDEQDWSATPSSRVIDLCLSDVVAGLSSQEALERLKKYGHFRLKNVPNYKLSFLFFNVIRSGKVKKVALNELVYGDIITFNKHDVVPARVRLLKVKGLEVQEQNISGVSAPAYKNIFIDHQNNQNVSVSKNMLYPNSIILKGKATGVIVDKPFYYFKSDKPVKKFIKNSYYMTKVVAKLLSQSDLIIFDSLSSPSDVLAAIQSIAIPKQIPCIFFLEHSLYFECASFIPQASSFQGSSSINNSLVLLYDSDLLNKAEVVASLNKNYKTLYIYSGIEYESAASMADCDIVLAETACPLAALRARIIAKKINVNDLTGYLYNKK